MTPSNPSLPVGLTQQFRATVTFTDGSTADLTTSAVWTSSSIATATIDSTSGLATAVAQGQATITATSGSISGSTTVNELTMTLLGNGKALAVGGIGLNNIPLGTAELYDPVSATWLPAGTLPADGAFHTQTLLPDGTVLVAGGDADGLSSAEIYDPLATTWSPGSEYVSSAYSSDRNVVREWYGARRRRS